MKVCTRQREKDSWELIEDRDTPMPFCLCILYCLLCELEVSHYFNINLHFLSQFGWSSHKCSALPTKKELVQVNFSFWNSPYFPPFLFPPSPSPLSQPNSALPFKKSCISSLQVNKNRTKCFTSALGVHGLA